MVTNSLLGLTNTRTAHVPVAVLSIAVMLRICHLQVLLLGITFGHAIQSSELVPTELELRLFGSLASGSWKMSCFIDAFNSGCLAGGSVDLLKAGLTGPFGGFPDGNPKLLGPIIGIVPGSKPSDTRAVIMFDCCKFYIAHDTYLLYQCMQKTVPKSFTSSLWHEAICYTCRAEHVGTAKPDMAVWDREASRLCSVDFGPSCWRFVLHSDRL